MTSSTILSCKGYSILKEKITEKELRSIRKELTVTPFDGQHNTFQQKNPFYLFRESSSRIFLPKYYGLSRFGKPDINRIVDGDPINVSFKGSLRKEQELPVAEFLRECENPIKMGGILNLPCAFGKTTIGIYIACALKKKTLIIVHKEFLLQQWIERIKTFCPEAKIGIIQGKNVQTEDADIVIGLLQSISMKSYSPSIFDGFGFVIIDEIHRTGAEVFSKALAKVNFKYSLGLSATMNRKDGLSKVFVWHVGDAIVRIEGRSDEVIVKQKKFTSSDWKYETIETLSNGKPNISKMVNNICESDERVRFINDELRKLLKAEPTRKIIILSDRKNHLHAIANNIDYCSSWGYYYGGMKQEELKKNEACQIILGTFQMSQEGLDISGLDTLVLASPKSDIVQSCGRILRDKPEFRKNIPMIIDIVDDFSIFTNQAKKRTAYFKKCKYTIEKATTESKESKEQVYKFR